MSSILKQSVISLVISFISIFSVYAGEYKTIHTLEPGEVISSDVLNEIINGVERISKPITKDDLLGTWDCHLYTQYREENYTDYSANDFDVVDHVFHHTTGTWTFYKEGEEYKWSEPAPGIWFLTYYLYDNRPDGHYYSLFQNLFCGESKSAYGGPIPENISYRTQVACGTILMLTPSRFVMRKVAQNHCYICDKQDSPPDNPNDLTASVDGLNVDLVWGGVSSLEGAYIVKRKDEIEQAYSEIGTTTSDTTIYQDTVPEAGKYWYRVFAENDYGESVGSNVAMVRVGSSPTATIEPATSITNTTGKLNGTVNANQSSTTIVFEYGADITYGENTGADESPVAGGADKSVSAILTDLDPGKTYHFRIKATNSVGTTYSADEVFTTTNN